MKRRDFLKVSAAGAAADRRGLAGDRAILARNQMAHDVEFPEVARHDLRRSAEYFAKYVAEMTDNKFQIQVFAGG